MATPNPIPCPCGSGAPRRECCPVPEPGPFGEPAPLLPDRELVEFLWRWARHRLGERFAPHRDYPGAIGCADCDTVLRTPWAVYDYPVDGRTVSEWFRRDYAELLGPPTARWLDAQSAAWLSIWAVLDRARGQHLELQDCFTGTRCVAREPWQSSWVPAGSYLCLRVVETPDGPMVAAQHPVAASAAAAAAAMEAARAALDAPVGRLEPARLRTPAAVAALIRAWEAPLAYGLVVTGDRHGVRIERRGREPA